MQISCLYSLNQLYGCINSDLNRTEQVDLEAVRFEAERTAAVGQSGDGSHQQHPHRCQLESGADVPRPLHEFFDCSAYCYEKELFPQRNGLWIYP